MIRVDTFEEYNAYVKNYKKEYKKTVTNCYLMPDEIESLAEKGKLQVLETDQVLAFIREENSAFWLYFYLGKEENPEFTFHGKPVVLDFVYRVGRQPEELFKKWMDCGFQEYKTFQRMKYALEEELSGPEYLLAGYEMEYGNINRCSEILELWKEGLGEISMAFPSESEMKELIERKRIVSIVNSENCLCAAMLWSGSGKTGMVHHIVVKECCRRQGLGEAVLKQALKDMQDAGMTSAALWVEENNHAAGKLYQRFGFEIDLTGSKQFVYHRS